MLDINLLRNDPEKVRENIRKKFQDEKLPMVDEVISMDKEYREAIQQGDNLRNKRKGATSARCCPRRSADCWAKARRKKPRRSRPRWPRWPKNWLRWK